MNVFAFMTGFVLFWILLGIVRMAITTTKQMEKDMFQYKRLNAIVPKPKKIANPFDTSIDYVNSCEGHSSHCEDCYYCLGRMKYNGMAREAFFSLYMTPSDTSPIVNYSGTKISTRVKHEVIDEACGGCGAKTMVSDIFCMMCGTVVNKETTL